MHFWCLLYMILLQIEIYQSKLPINQISSKDLSTFVIDHYNIVDDREASIFSHPRLSVIKPLEILTFVSVCQA